MIPRKTDINICVSLIKQHWKKLAVIQQNCKFSLGAFKISKKKLKDLENILL